MTPFAFCAPSPVLTPSPFPMPGLTSTPLAEPVLEVAEVLESEGRATYVSRPNIFSTVPVGVSVLILPVRQAEQVIPEVDMVCVFTVAVLVFFLIRNSVVRVDLDLDGNLIGGLYTRVRVEK